MLDSELAINAATCSHVLPAPARASSEARSATIPSATTCPVRARRTWPGRWDDGRCAHLVPNPGAHAALQFVAFKDT